MSNIFNKHGELNASNVQDALSQIVKYASIIEDLQPSNATQAAAPSLNDEQRDEMIKQALMTQADLYMRIHLVLTRDLPHLKTKTSFLHSIVDFVLVHKFRSTRERCW